MIIVGLTGSIGMGKSTAAAAFAKRGVPIFEADATVHALYRGAAAGPIEAAFRGTTRDGVVDRVALSERALGDKTAIATLEAIVHPLVRAEETAFLKRAAAAWHPVVVLDIPLLFEKNGELRVDVTVVVSASAEIQRRRVLARPGMSPAKLDAILALQMSDAEKRRRAHFVIDTNRSLAAADRQIASIWRSLMQMSAKGLPRRLR